MRIGAFVLGLGIFGSVLLAAESVTVTSVSGKKNDGVLKSWMNGRLVFASTTDQEFDLADVRSVIFEHTPQRMSTGETGIWLTGGDRVSAKVVSTANEHLNISWPLCGSSDSPKIPLERIVAIILEWPLTGQDQQRMWSDIAACGPGSDVLMFRNGDRSQGEFEKLDASFVDLKGATGLLKLDRSRVRAICFNPELSAATPGNPTRAILALIDGSRITATSVEMDESGYKVLSTTLGKLSLPPDSVVSCHFFSDTVVPLSDRDPAKIRFTPYLSAQWTLVRNANVFHSPLTLRGNEFAIGLGMHSRMEVTYNLLEGDREFQGVVGIDDAAKGAGSALFAVELDGKRVWNSQELTGKSPATSVPSIKLRGSKEITLFVEFGQTGDVSDYADWCDTVLIRDRAR